MYSYSTGKPTRCCWYDVPLSVLKCLVSPVALLVVREKTNEAIVSDFMEIVNGQGNLARVKICVTNPISNRLHFDRAVI